MKATKWNQYLRIEKYNNLAEMVFDTIRLRGEKRAMRWFTNGTEKVEMITYNQLGEKITKVFHSLKKLGYMKGDHIAICSETSQNWAFADLGVQCLGGVTVAIYPSLTPKEILYILNDSEAKVIFVDTQENMEKVLNIWDELDTVKLIIVCESMQEVPNQDIIMTFDEFLLVGEPINDENILTESICSIREGDLASLIYTSGTTGIPKGVMLTHKNFLSDIVASSAIATTYRKDEKPWEHDSITYLPYAHSFGRTVEEYSLIYNGSCINYVGGRSQERLQKAFKAFQPTLFVGVPYVFQKLYEKIMNSVKEMPDAVQNLFQSALETGKTYYQNLIDGKTNPLGLKVKYWLFKKLVFKRIKKELGGKIDIMLSGSAALSPKLMLFFLACDFDMVEGYGLTETAPVTHTLRNEENSDFRPNFEKKIPIYEKIGTVGPPIEIIGNVYENVQQKLSPEGELLIKGPMVMKGYWNKPDLTQAVLDDDGWFHTGDICKIDEDGYLTIKGRAKAIIKLSTGKMISPAAVEGQIVPYSKIIAQIILVGQEKKYLTAIIVPYQQALREYAETHGIEYKKWEDLIRNPGIQGQIKQDIITHLKDVSGFSAPKRFALSSMAFGEEDGYLTPTLKFKRNKVYDDFAHIIDRLYEIDGEFLVIEERLTDFYDQTILA